ncbi:protein shisa-5 isoform X1 [Pezoporus occidentalis]|uniref:protein shisa-5 isoform X1 n=1 Tax=Pezoporus occidentalis TaxID=407982 RepID=UPI002F914B93
MVSAANGCIVARIYHWKVFHFLIRVLKFLLLCSSFQDGFFGTLAAIGVAVCAVIIITIILCLTCSCCCLYKACRRPRPVVTTTSTTVVHAPYPQQQGASPNYQVAPYQGYQPVAIPPQPGMPVAPYPAQYPPPYPVQPSGPPAYCETVAAGAGAPYPVSQPPYNPAYVDPQKLTY